MDFDEILHLSHTLMPLYVFKISFESVKDKAWARVEIRVDICSDSELNLVEIRQNE